MVRELDEAEQAEQVALAALELREAEYGIKRSYKYQKVAADHLSPR